ncbi:MAG: Rieske 2Fe-2S domain-containing protein, partial [Burkholderiales bacterium]|nr:Rieske 2Fe-2S domain-containing protein [Burkholderiales bacterium]
MSDLSVNPAALERSRSQLSVSSYFDPEVYRREMASIFARSPRYLGHELAVPEIGDYHALVHEGEGRALVRTANGVELISNVCRHRQALMLRGRGSVRAQGGSEHIVCPLHRWTYDLQGRL